MSFQSLQEATNAVLQESEEEKAREKFKNLVLVSRSLQEFMGKERELKIEELQAFSQDCRNIFEGLFKFQKCGLNKTQLQGKSFLVFVASLELLVLNMAICLLAKKKRDSQLKLEEN